MLSIDAILAMIGRISILAGIASGVFATSAVVACDVADMRFEDSFFPYGPNVPSAMTNLARCGDYRVFVVYSNGTDMLFLDKLVPTGNGSALVATDGMPFAEFNHYEASTEIESITCKVIDPKKLQISGRAYSFHSNKPFGFSISVDVAKHCYTYEDTERKQGDAEQAAAGDARNART